PENPASYRVVRTKSYLFNKARFMLPASQKNNIAEMKRTFLEPALKKINEKTPLKVTYTTEEDGRLLFNFLDKKQ
ncbi:TPA: replication initiation protein, partial [Klebsiella pneumoniae]